MTPIKIIFCCLAVACFACHSPKEKKTPQKEDRVKAAFEEKSALLHQQLKKHDLELNNIDLLFIAYKAESELVLYAKPKQGNKYKQIMLYPICAKSGELGPKIKEGDRQVPEGFYHINVFNPESDFWLSLGINYPNKADSLRNKTEALGGDIYMHGNCMTIGCLPMTDDKIKEIYTYADQARQNGQEKIPIYIFPFRFTTKNMRLYDAKYSHNPSLLSFWRNLAVGYQLFHHEKEEISYEINTSGEYVFSQ